MASPHVLTHCNVSLWSRPVLEGFSHAPSLPTRNCAFLSTCFHALHMPLLMLHTRAHFTRVYRIRWPDPTRIAHSAQPTNPDSLCPARGSHGPLLGEVTGYLGIQVFQFFELEEPFFSSSFLPPEEPIIDNMEIVTTILCHSLSLSLSWWANIAVQQSRSILICDAFGIRVNMSILHSKTSYKQQCIWSTA